jgi:8-oxo-dGTP pyrophosphatase MutT (NUDIX family)
MKHSKLSALQGDGLDMDQIGALCWRLHRGKVEVLLVTSRDTGRWVIPKGWPMTDRSGAEAAATEAWEEGGAKGTVTEAPLGVFLYDKVLKPGVLLPCRVAVYPLRVTKLADSFPERKQRRRKWFATAKAARKVAEPTLRDMLAALTEVDGALAVLPVAAEAAARGPDADAGLAGA